MENVTAHHVQDVDKCAEQVMANCLRNPVVLRIILEHCPNSELLRLSLVNKLWNYEARSVMKSRGNLTVHFTCANHHPCLKDFVAFAAGLRPMNVVPFSGISIKIKYHACRSVPIHHILHAICKQLPLQYASVELRDDEWRNFKHCPAFLLAKKIVLHFSGTLEKLSLDIHSRQRDEIVKEFVQDRRFPRLKILKLKGSLATGDATQINYLKAVIDRAPVLQELCATGPVRLIETALRGRPEVLVFPAIQCPGPFDGISETFASQLRLSWIALTYTGPEFNMERFSTITRIILSCNTTLDEISLDAVLAVPFMCYGLCLGNVKYLNLFIAFSQLELIEPRILIIVKNFDFTRIFPNLTEVSVSNNNVVELSQDHINAIVRQANANLGAPKPDRAVNIKELNLWEPLSNNSCQFYALMFPSVERLTVYRNPGEDIPFESLSRHWDNLRELKISPERYRNRENLDSTLCGIFSEEVAELKEKDEGFLKKVMIVPVAPSLACLRNLQKFTLEYDFLYHNPDYEFEDRLMFIPSKVTGLLAFARFPNLAVTLKTHHRPVFEALRQMEPYATVVLETHN